MTFGTLISVEELALHLHEPSCVVVDCRHTLADFSAGARLYAEGHIPGAFFASVEDDLAGEKTGRNGRHPLPDLHRFGELLRGFGIDNGTQIVAYDAGGDMFAARMWFLLRYAGHDAVAVLDGGLAAWIAAGRPLETRLPAKPQNGSIDIRVRDRLRVGVQEVEASLRDRKFTLLDARAADRFAGRNETIDPVGGHIPGAFNRSFKENFDDRGHFKPPAALRSEFAALRMPEGPIVHQCGSGVSAAVNMLAMEVADLPETQLYPGSWSEWCSDPARPVAIASSV